LAILQYWFYANSTILCRSVIFVCNAAEIEIKPILFNFPFIKKSARIGKHALKYDFSSARARQAAQWRADLTPHLIFSPSHREQNQQVATAFRQMYQPGRQHTHESRALCCPKRESERLKCVLFSLLSFRLDARMNNKIIKII
jgi:hypothetical protein